MYPIIFLGSLPGALLASAHFADEHVNALTWCVFAAAFIIGQSLSYFLCRKWNL